MDIIKEFVAEPLLSCYSIYHLVLKSTSGAATFHMGDILTHNTLLIGTQLQQQINCNIKYDDITQLEYNYYIESGVLFMVKGVN